MKVSMLQGFKAFSYSCHRVASCPSHQLQCLFQRAHKKKNMPWRQPTFPGPLPCLLPTDPVALSPSGLGAPKPGFFQDRDKLGDVPSRWILTSTLEIMTLVEKMELWCQDGNEEGPTSSVEIASICVSWANATS